jgi:soluble P-type ATPase
VIRTGKDKAKIIDALGPSRVAAIGNGRNDVAMMRKAALRIAIIGPEGASAQLASSADVLVRDIREGLDLLLNPLRLVATLRE